jgi:hypothetical protein
MLEAMVDCEARKGKDRKGNRERKGKEHRKERNEKGRIHLSPTCGFQFFPPLARSLNVLYITNIENVYTTNPFGVHEETSIPD